MSGSHGHAPPQGPPHRPRPVRRGRLLAVLLIGAAMAYLATGVHVVQTDEQALVRRFGRARQRSLAPGLYLGLPYGLDRVTRVKVRQTQRVGIGIGLADRALGRSGRPRQREYLTGDTNLILVSAVVQYRVSPDRLGDYCFRVADVAALVRNVAAAELTRRLATGKVDDVLTTERRALQAEVRQATQAALDRYRAGVQVLSVLLPDKGVAPPEEVADAFRDVDMARANKRQAIRQAEGYANRLAPETRGEAHRIRAEAAGDAEQAVARATGEAERFRKEAAELTAHRRLTLHRLVLETMEEVLPRLRLIVLDPNAAAVDLGLIEGGR